MEDNNTPEIIDSPTSNYGPQRSSKKSVKKSYASLSQDNVDPTFLTKSGATFAYWKARYTKTITSHTKVFGAGLLVIILFCYIAFTPNLEAGVNEYDTDDYQQEIPNPYDEKEYYNIETPGGPSEDKCNVAK